MLIDLRTYRVQPNSMDLHMKLYETYGYDVQRRHLGEPVAYLLTESGRDVNSYVHIWAYEDAGDRERRRAALQADPQWHEMCRRSAEAGYLIGQENTLMRPAPFFRFPDRSGS